MDMAIKGLMVVEPRLMNHVLICITLLLQYGVKQLHIYKGLF